MHPGNKWPCVALALLLPAAVGLGQARAESKKTKAAAAPEEAVKYYLAAARAGDLNGVLAQRAEPQRGYLKANVEFHKVQQALARALDDEFGKDKNAPAPPPAPREELKAIKDLRVVSKKPRGKDKVELTLWQTSGEKGRERIDEFPATAIKEPGGWKLVFPMGQVKRSTEVTRKGPDGKEVEVFENVTDESKAPTAERMRFFAKTMPKYRAAMEKVVKDIKGGKYTKRSEALRAVGAATQAFYKDNPPPKQDK
jgi:hypothetical protein